MEENRFNQTLRDKFQDLESPFNDRVTFEAVMKKREKKKRRVIFWLPSVAVVAGLFLSAGLGYMFLSDSNSAVKSYTGKSFNGVKYFIYSYFGNTVMDVNL